MKISILLDNISMSLPQILLIFGVFSCAYGTEVSENECKVYSCQIKQEQCQFATVAPTYHTQCKNDDTICSGGGGESDPCEGDSPDPEGMKFCTAKMPEISDLTDAQKPWVLCSQDCFVGSSPKNYTATTGCAAEVRKCKFPFKFNDKEYTKCTNDLLFPSDSDDRTEENFKWCATSTNSDGSMKKGKWGRCDEATCKCVDPETGGLSGGAIAGIIIAIIAALGGAAGGVFYAKKNNMGPFAREMGGIPVPLN